MSKQYEKTWKGINELIGNNSNLSLKIPEVTNVNESITEPHEIANTFNNFFTNVGPNLDRDIPTTPKSPLSFLLNRVTQNLKFKNTTNPEVMIILLQLDDKKSAGPSDLPINILNIAAPIIVPLLVRIFNTSLATGTFPKLMKVAKVIPKFKSGNKLSVTNYRPISLLSQYKMLHFVSYVTFYSHIDIRYCTS